MADTIQADNEVVADDSLGGQHASAETATRGGKAAQPSTWADQTNTDSVDEGLETQTQGDSAEMRALSEKVAALLISTRSNFEEARTADMMSLYLKMNRIKTDVEHQLNAWQRAAEEDLTPKSEMKHLMYTYKVEMVNMVAEIDYRLQAVEREIAKFRAATEAWHSAMGNPRGTGVERGTGIQQPMGVQQPTGDQQPMGYQQPMGDQQPMQV